MSYLALVLLALQTFLLLDRAFDLEVQLLRSRQETRQENQGSLVE